MKPQFVDTTIFLRHLTQDEPGQAQACFDLFQRAAANQLTLTTSEAVLVEVVSVLSSSQLYRLSPPRIKQLLYPLLSLPGLKLPQRQTYLRALTWYAQYPLDFVSCLTLAHMARQRLSKLYSYAGDCERLPGITRLEPPADEQPG